MRIVVLGIDLGKNLCSLAGLDETGAVVSHRTMSSPPRDATRWP
jgi:transposase